MRMTFLLYEGVEPVDLAAIGVFSMARRVLPELSYETVAITKEPVVLANGLRVLPDRTLDEVYAVDVLFVPGGPGWRSASQDARVLEFIRRVARKDLVYSVCTGAMVLAEAGVLDGLDATTKVEVVDPEVSPLQEMRERFPSISARAALIVDNGRVVTGGGVTLCIDATLYLLETRFGCKAAEEVARIMEYAAARTANGQRFAQSAPLSR